MKKKSNEIKELQRRVRLYEKIILRWRAAIDKPSWKKGESVNEVEDDLIFLSGDIRFERFLNKKVKS